MAPTPTDRMQASVTASPLQAKYGTAIDPESAREIPGAKLDAAAANAAAAAQAAAQTAAAKKSQADYEKMQRDWARSQPKASAPRSTTTRRTVEKNTVEKNTVERNTVERERSAAGSFLWEGGSLIGIVVHSDYAYCPSSVPGHRERRR